MTALTLLLCGFFLTGGAYYFGRLHGVAAERRRVVYALDTVGNIVASFSISCLSGFVREDYDHAFMQAELRKYADRKAKIAEEERAELLRRIKEKRG